jgi:membrane-bound serine protease (ClpP class)
LIASITAAILYFAPHYLEGLAGNWEIIMFFIGLALLAVEIFVIPGFGVAGISGIILILTSLTLSMVDSFPQGGNIPSPRADDLLKALLTVFLSLIVSGGIAVLIGKNMFKFAFAKNIVLDATTSREQGYVSSDENVKDTIGKSGIAITNMRPVGKVEIDGIEYEAKSMIGFIDKGDTIKVTATDMTTLIVIKE